MINDTDFGGSVSVSENQDTVTRWARLLPGQMEMTTSTSQSYANKIDNSTKHYVHGI